MILATHFIVGAAVATNIPNPLLGLLAAIFSHYLLDIIPHRDYSIENLRRQRWKESLGDFSKTGLDFAVGVLVVFYFAKDPLFGFLAGSLAIIPDQLAFLSAGFFKSKLLAAHQNLHCYLPDAVGRLAGYANAEEFSKKIPLLLGAAEQLLIIVVAIFFLLK